MTEQLVDDSSIIINYMAVSEEAAIEFKSLLLANIPLSVPSENKYECKVNSHVIEDGTTHSFVIVTLYVSGDSEQILIALDDIKNGSLYETMGIVHKFSVDSIHSHMMFGDGLQLLSSVSYLHNKGQYTSNEIGFLQQDFTELRDTVEAQQKLIEVLVENYSMLQAFIHNYIDIIKLKSIVVELAEKVDPDILDSFRIIQVH